MCSNDGKCTAVKQYPVRQVISSGTYPSYCPDTPLVEIARKAQEERAEAMQYQHKWQTRKSQDDQCCDLPPLEKGLLPPPPPPADYTPDPDPWVQKIQQKQWCSPARQFKCPNQSEYDSDSQMAPVNCGCGNLEETFQMENCVQRNVNNNPEENCTRPQSNPDCERLKEVAAACDQKLAKLQKKGEEEPDIPKAPTACDFAKAPIEGALPGPIPKPNETECEKFMQFVQGRPSKMKLYDLANREAMQKNFQQCSSTESACFKMWDKKTEDDECPADEGNKCYDCSQEVVIGCEDRVKDVPPGCCDYRKLNNLSDRFEPPGFDFCCPPMPENVPKLCMPGWMECPPEITVPPFPPPSGAKIKPISKGIRTNFERNKTCHKCGAKRKKPPKPECAAKNCPALKEYCSTQKPSACCGQVGTGIMEQINSLRKMIGI